MATKTKITAAQKKSIRKAVDDAQQGKVYDYDRISSRIQAVREQAAAHNLTPAEVEATLAGRDDEDEIGGPPTVEELEDLGPAPVEVGTPSDVDPSLVEPLEVTSARAHEAQATLGQVEKENEKLAREQAREERREEREARREEAASKAPAKKAPAKKTTSGRSTGATRRR